MKAVIRSYIPSDYPQLLILYRNSKLYGGQFDENRDAEEKLKRKIEADPDAILIAEKGGEIIGTVSLIEDGRIAWLFRFCVVDEEGATSSLLFDKAKEILVGRGHHQVLVYSPAEDTKFNGRYQKLGFTKGGDYTCFWKDIEHE